MHRLTSIPSADPDLSAFKARGGNWVGKGEAPASLLGAKQDNDGKTVWTRPLCP